MSNITLAKTIGYTEESENNFLMNSKSLMEYYNITYYEIDNEFGITINDFNYSWVDYCITTVHSKVNIPFKFISNKTGMEFTITKRFNKEGTYCEDFTIPSQYLDDFNIPSTLIKWGFNSTLLGFTGAGSGLDSENYHTGLNYTTTEDSEIYAVVMKISCSGPSCPAKFGCGLYYNNGTLAGVTQNASTSTTVIQTFNMVNNVTVPNGENIIATCYVPSNALYSGSYYRTTSTGNYSYRIAGSGGNYHPNPIALSRYDNYLFYQYLLYEPTGESCTANLTNTSWSSWTNISCLPTDLMNVTRNLTQYDINDCGGANTTIVQYNSSGACDYCTPSLTNTTWINISCLPDDTMNQSITQYDSNYCGEIANSTIYRNIEFCDYCTPNMTNTTPSAWSSIGCIGNQTNQSRYFIQYDSNYCGEIANSTIYEFQLINPTWANNTESWFNISSCYANSTIDQQRVIIQYDINLCGTNTTINEYQTINCTYAPPPPINITGRLTINIQNKKIPYIILNNISKIFMPYVLLGKTEVFR